MKRNIRPYTKQFFRNNRINFILAFSEVMLVTIGMLTISWLLQQVVDLIAGNNTRFSLGELSIVASIIFVGCVLSYLISYESKPRFITKGISQYKEFIFEKITKKNISAFVGENSSKYISSLTNDIQIIEKGYLFNIFDIVANIILFIGALVMMFIYSPLLTAIALGLTILPIFCTVIICGRMAKSEKVVSDQN